MAEKPKDWLVVQPSLEPLMVIPNAIIKTIDSVLSFVVTLLNIANMILNVIKVFLVGLLDPIRAIVEAIIEENEGHGFRKLENKLAFYAKVEAFLDRNMNVPEGRVKVGTPVPVRSGD